MKNTQKPKNDSQYFCAQPESEDRRRTFEIILRGNKVNATTSNGVFSANRLDPGTSVLLDDAPEPAEEGNVLDIGCGWGPICLALAGETKATVWALDVNERALQLAELNAKNNGFDNIRAVTAEQIDDSTQFDTIWSNPPIRIGKEQLHEILLTWLPRLKNGGFAYLVVQKHLGADSLIKWLSERLNEEDIEGNYEVKKYSSSKGYRVIEVAKTDE